MNEVDSRVVQMQFDNAGFEQKVQSTLSILQSLSSRLDTMPATQGVDGLASNVETLNHRFSALGIIGMTALQNITNSAVNTGKRVLSALTIAPPKEGLQEYETQLNSVQTILANTKSKGTTLKDVNKALDELNTYADKTIYNFSQMTRNIGTFTAAGVDLKTSVSAIQGIANLAAVSGSTSQQASTAMYQLSQALATGTVKLQDWNSVVNAGMGGEVFQNALTRTAAVMAGSAEDVEGWRKANIKSYGSFRESLTKGAWLTTDVLTETLNQFTLANDKQSKAMLKKKGYTDKQIKEILEMGETAMDAATKVKTFTQLIDTLKEALGSGWAQTWRTVIGDFEQARTLWTAVSDELNTLINNQADARNKLLEGWAKGGGRDDLLEGLKNIYLALSAIPMLAKDAFNNIFPPMTAEKLVDITKKFREFTENLPFRHDDKYWGYAQDFFEGIFSIAKVGLDVLLNLGKIVGPILTQLAPLGEVVLKAAGAFGRFASGTSEFITKSQVINKVSTAMANAIEHTKESIVTMGKYIAKVLAPVIQLLKGAFDRISDIFGDSDKMARAFKIGTLSAVLLMFTKFIKEITNPLTNLKGLIGDVFKPLSKVFGDMSSASGSIKDAFSALKDGLNLLTGSVQAHIIRSYATSLILLAIAVGILSSIKVQRLMRALFALEVMALELSLTVKLISGINVNSKKLDAVGKAMVSVAVAMAIMAYSMKMIADLEWEDIAKGVVGLTAISALMVAMGKAFSGRKATKMTKGLSGLILMAAAIKLLCSAMADLSGFSWEELGKGIAGIAALAVILGGMSRFSKGGIFKGAGLIEMAYSLSILFDVVKRFSSLNVDAMKKGLGGIGILMLEFSAFSRLSKGGIFKGAGLVLMATSINILYSSVARFSKLKANSLKQGLAAVGALMLELAIFSRLSASGGKMIALGTAINGIAFAMSMLTPVLLALGKVKRDTLIQGLVGLGAAFTIIGIAGKLLTPVIPTLIGFGIALVLIGGGLTLLGTGLVTIGAGLVTIAGGIAALAVSATTNVTAIATSFTIILETIINSITEIAGSIVRAFVVFVQEIAANVPALIQAASLMIQAFVGGIKENVPLLIETAVTLLDAFLRTLAGHAESLVDSGLKILIGVLSGIRDNIGEVVNTAYEVVVAFIDGLASAIEKNAKPLRNAVIHLMKAMIEAMLVFLGIHSPSKKAEQIGKFFVQGFIKGLTSIKDGVVNAAKNIGVLAKNALSKVKGFKDIAIDKIKSFIDGIKSKADSVKTHAEEIAKKVKNGIKPDSLYNIGQSAIQGFINGVGSLRKAAMDKANSIADSVKEKFKSAFKINSPSKVMHAIGAGVIEGLINGMDSLSSDAIRTSTDIATRFKDSFSGIASKITEFSDFYDNAYTPTITPVLDLSRIQNGMRDVDSLFSKQQALAVDANLAKSDKDDNLIETLVKGFNDVVDKINNMPGPKVDVTVPLSIDGRELARSQATLNEEEISRIQFHENRKLGIV